jgi:hypothetical protein
MFRICIDRFSRHGLKYQIPNDQLNLAKIDVENPAGAGIFNASLSDLSDF